MLREEKTMVYYLVNLILFKHYNMANSLIKKHFLKMRNCSEIFKANVWFYMKNGPTGAGVGPRKAGVRL